MPGNVYKEILALFLTDIPIIPSLLLSLNYKLWILTKITYIAVLFNVYMVIYIARQYTNPRI